MVRPSPPAPDEFVGFLCYIALVERVKWRAIYFVSQLGPVNAEHIAPDLSVPHVAILLGFTSNDNEEVVLSHLFS